jgi:hypothetical protein
MVCREQAKVPPARTVPTGGRDRSAYLGMLQELGLAEYYHA